MKKIRILSVDGGGIRGIMSGTMIAYLEKKIKQKTGNKNASIGEYFDFIAGTSTGGILACTYLIPDAKGNYKFTAKDSLNLYLERGDEIFDVSFKQKLKSLGGINDEKYDAAELIEALEDYFTDVKLSQLKKPCLITSYDIRNRKAHFFTSADATTDDFDFYVKDVARATSAAPTYFEPARVKSIFGTPYALIDGGVFANNPTLCAYAEARTLDFSKLLKDKNKPKLPTAKDMIIVSVGTGTQKEAMLYKDFKDAGMIKWIKPLIDVMMSGNAETVSYQVRQIFNTLTEENKSNYYRLEPILKQADNAMDNGSVDNLKALYQDGVASIEHYKKELDEIVDKLIENH